MNFNIQQLYYKFVIIFISILLIIDLLLHFNWFSLILLSLILLSIIVNFSYKLINKRNAVVEEIEHKKKIEDFKLKSQKTTIDLTKFKIKSNSWKETIITDKSQYAGINELIGQGDKNIAIVDRKIHIIEIPIKINQKILNHTFRSNKDLNVIKISLLEKKTTTLYFNPDDESEYFLDLDFFYD